MNETLAEVSFYQLTTHPLEKVLPRILEKVYSGGLRALVVTDTAQHMQALNSALWTYSSGAFLPHSMEADQTSNPDDNPIWISLDPHNKNNAAVLVLTGGKYPDDLSSYKRCVDIFDGNDMQALSAAHKRRDQYRQKGHPIVYWQQTLSGTWDQVPLD